MTAEIDLSIVVCTKLDIYLHYYPWVDTYVGEFLVVNGNIYTIVSADTLADELLVPDDYQ
jgi:hypothetical protein